MNNDNEICLVLHFGGGKGVQAVGGSGIKGGDDDAPRYPKI